VFLIALAGISLWGEVIQTEQWCSDCGVLFIRSLGSSTSSSPPIKFTVPLGRSGLNLLSAQKLTDSKMEISSQRPSQSRVKPNPSDVGIKAVQLQDGDSSKIALIGGGLSDKKESVLISFLRAN
jgi:hypothetical protein